MRTDGIDSFSPWLPFTLSPAVAVSSIAGEEASG